MHSAGLLRRFENILSSRWTAPAFFAIVLVLGLVIAKDYGISWDEKAMYVLGEEAYDHITRGTPYPAHEGIRFHGAWLEILQYAAQEMMGMHYARHVFIMRHMITYFMFFVGVVSVYVIALRTFKHRGWALLVAVMFFLSPRQFGHAFFNARDIPTMSFFTLKMFTLLLFLDAPSVKRAVLDGIASGLVMAIRIGGLFVPIFTVLFFALRIMREWIVGEWIDWKRYGICMIALALVSMIATVAFWPLLWENPGQNFVAAMHNMMTSQNAAGGFYLGEAVGQPPWHWIPVHILTKTPFLYTGLFLAGCVHLFVGVRRPLTFLTERFHVLLFFLWFTIPIAVAILLQAKLFDEWRHMYFIYPAMLLLAVHGLRELLRAAASLSLAWARTAIRVGLVVICVGSFAETGIWMVGNHPLQYVYFSLPSRWVEGKFDLDYWGLSFREGFEWILQNDSASPITLNVTSSPGWENLNILTREQRRRLIVTTEPNAKYTLDNYRWKNYEHTLPEDWKVHSITVSDMDVLGIYRNPQWTESMVAGLPLMEDEEIELRFDPKSMP